MDKSGEKPIINAIKKFPPDIDDGASFEAVKKFCFPKLDTNW